MAKNIGESRIPVSRAVRPSFLLSKSKIISQSSKYNVQSSTDRKAVILSELDENNVTKSKDRTADGLDFTFSSVAKDNLQDESFDPWNTKDNSNSGKKDIVSQCKEDNYLNKIYGQVNSLEDIPSNCVIDSTSNTLNELNGDNNEINNTRSLNIVQQYLCLNKQNSFEQDESLGILTPDQMTDFTIALGCSRTPSYENLAGLRFQHSSNLTKSSQPIDIPLMIDTELSSIFNECSPSLEELPLDPKPIDHTVKTTINNADQSLMIKNNNNQENSTSSISISSSISSNNINNINNNSNNSSSSVPIITNSIISGSNSVQVSTTSLPMSFVTSVTSITSLEAGYQGDGENSRPASRGPEPSSIPNENLTNNLATSCQSCRLQDQLTDSDFFTESDADIHEDISRGDRKAQVIDGTLFCAPGGRRCPSFVGEEMDSSGIYSDLDKRQDEQYNFDEILSEDQSPDTVNTNDTGDTQISQKVSPILNFETPQDMINLLQISKTPFNDCIKDNKITEKKSDSQISIYSPISNESNRSNKTINNKSDNVSLKKYKMPKKNVASKIKAMIESNNNNNNNNSSNNSNNNKEESIKEPRRIVRTPRKNGRWDAVMSKIEAGKTEQRSRLQRKEVKSRLLQTLGQTCSSSSTSSSSSSSTTTSTSSSTSSSSSSAATVASAKKLDGESNNNGNINKDKRRTRLRQNISSPIQETARSSVRSSMSDLSNVSKRSPGAVNQQRRTPNGRNSIKSRTINADPKKPCTLDPLSPFKLDKSPTLNRKLVSARRTVAHKNAVKSDEKQSSDPSLINNDKPHFENKIIPVAVVTQNSTNKQDQGVQVDVTEFELNNESKKYNCDTIQALCLTIQYLSNQLEEYSSTTTKLENLNLIRINLERNLEQERKDHQKSLEEFRRCLEENHVKDIDDLKNNWEKEKNKLKDDFQNTLDELMKEHEIKIDRMKTENRLELESKELYWKEKNNELLSNTVQLEIKKLKDEINDLKLQIKEKILLEDKIKDLEKELQIRNDELYYNINDLNISTINNTYESTLDCNSSINSDQTAEIWSLRSVLELRSQENASLRSENDILRRDAEAKDSLLQRIETSEARCEDLKAQLQRKESYERKLSHQNEILLGSFHEITKHNKRLTQKNEELQWRLRQKNEFVNVLANQLVTPPRLSRSMGPENIDHSIIADKDLTPSSSSMIKFMVQKDDSVSWTLDIDDSCDPLSNDELKSTTAQLTRDNSMKKKTRKSSDIRGRSKSISTSDIVRHDDIWMNSNVTRRRPRSGPSASSTLKPTSNIANTDTNVGPKPQEAGGEAMISEETSATSSDDESSASSNIQHLAMEFNWVNSNE